MRIVPVLLDSRPDYIPQGAGSQSLLLLPLANSTLLQHLLTRLFAITPEPAVVLSTFEPEAAYREAIQGRVEAVVSQAAFAEHLRRYEPSDWLLMVDPTCFVFEGFDLSAFVHRLGRQEWKVTHVVALDLHASGTNESVHADPDGRVRRIQRYYDVRTWPFTRGVTCSLLPVACTLVAADLPFGSLAGLRKALANHGVPSRDIPIATPVFDLSDEAGFLGLNERLIVELFSSKPARSRGDEPAWEGSGRAHPNAQILGPVLLQEGAEVDEEATVVGPALVAAGARIGRRAVVAQCVVTSAGTVPAGATVRHRVVVGGLALSPPRTSAPRVGDFNARRAAVPRDIHDTRRKGVRYTAVKPVADALLAGLGLLLFSPLLAMVALVVKISSRGPVLYGDWREGKAGTPFRCWKFRTMGVGADSEQRKLLQKNQVDGPQFKLKNDPRVTRVGRWLRTTNLDELPQLFNVLRGQMSLVGPRPSPFRENQLCVPWRERRLSVRPGITGLWQICRQKRSSGDFHQWIYYDMLYVSNLSAWLDLKILVFTALSVGGKWGVPLSRVIPPQPLTDEE